MFGDVFISSDGCACALLVYPDRRKATFKSVLWDIKLVFQCIGFLNIGKTFRRESFIKKIHPKEAMTYLWFIGVAPDRQRKGIGSRMLTEILENSQMGNRPVYVETSTSTLSNLPWYRKFGFRVYHEEDIDYKLYFLNNNKPD